MYKHQLYEAATEALVSESSANSTFEKIVAAGYTIGNAVDFKDELIETEVTIKKEFELKTMPGPWRSAKSVVLTALLLGIKLVDDNGHYLGKTALQLRIKNNKDKKEETTSSYLTKITNMIRNIPDTSTVDKTVVLNEIASFINTIK